MKTQTINIESRTERLIAVREFVSEDGKTRLDQEYVVAMPINGRLLRLRLEEGERVTSGQIVARVDDFDLRQQLDKLRSQVDEIRFLIESVDIAKPKPEDIESARLKAAEAQLQAQSAAKSVQIATIAFADAEREFHRNEQLLAEKVIQRAQYDVAKRVYDTARTQLADSEIREQASSHSLEIARVAYDRIRRSVDDNEYQRGVYQAQIREREADIALLRDQLAKTTIRAPVCGIVLERNLESEQVLTAGTPILKIGDMNTLEIESDILSEEVGRVQPGQRVEITGKALDFRTVEGTVKRIYPGGFKKISALGIEQQRVKVIVAFDNGALQLRPYVSVDLRIIVDEHRDVLTVPDQTVFKNGDEWAVLVIENERLALRPVRVGLRNDQLVEVVEGLAPADVVVAEPTNELRAGQRARPAA